MHRMILTSLITLSLMAGSSLADNGLVTDKLGKKIDSVVLTDLQGKAAPLNAIKGKKAIVVVFLSFECPVSNDYAALLTEMHKQYSAKGIAFIAISTSDDLADVKKQASEFKLPFPIYVDPKLDAVDAFKATTTPEAFVLDRNSVLRYRGRIDNAFSARLKKNMQTTEHDLKNAIDDLLAGNDVKVPATKAIGCAVVSKEAINKSVSTKITFYKDVLPILQNNCQECHRPNAVGPFSLVTYKQASSWADDIKSYTQEKKMPPWKPTVGPSFHNERKLADEQIKTLAAWVDGGTPEGDAKDAPKPKEFVEGWHLGKPDLILTVDDEFTLGASGRDMFRCFVLPTNLDADQYITGFEIKPGNNRIVHHTLNFWDLSGEGRKKAAKSKEEAKAADQDHGPGYSSAMGVGFLPKKPGTFGAFGGWAPGQMPRFLPEGTGYFLPKGADLIIQTHYHRDGKEEKDKLRVGLYFAKKKIEMPYQTLVVAGFGPFQFIPAGKSDYIAKGNGVLNSDCTLHSVMPHMHLLGKSVKITMTPPDSSPQTLVEINEWDYNWQETYWFKEPMQIKAGTKFEIEALFDNSDKNPNNPRSPPGIVFIGEQTTNEMLFGFLGATTEKKGTRLFARPAGKLKKDEKK